MSIKLGQKVVAMTAFPVCGELIDRGGSGKCPLVIIKTKEGRLHNVPPSLLFPYQTLDKLEKKRREKEQAVEKLPLANRVYKRGQRRRTCEKLS